MEERTLKDSVLCAVVPDSCEQPLDRKIMVFGACAGYAWHRKFVYQHHTDRTHGAPYMQTSRARECRDREFIGADIWRRETYVSRHAG